MSKPQGNEPTITAPLGDESIGLQVSARHSVEAQAAQRAAMQEWARRNQPGKYTVLPNGQMVEVRGSVMHKYPGAKKTILMARPDMVIKPEFRKPDFGEGMPRYQWRCRTDTSTSRRDLETANLHRRQLIRYVEMNEIDNDSQYAQVEAYAVPGPGNNVYVIMDSAILCEILAPELSYEGYKYWTDLAMSNVSDLDDVVRGYRDTEINNKTRTEVAQRNSRQGG